MVKSKILAILGPTNTGKTHLAMDRMMAYKSGVIGFPLRLLARENFERALEIKGKEQVALITGEEKIIPANPNYFVCTVESMPTDQVCEFLAVDEIQMCADKERGHIFTDRLLNARGYFETMFLGAETIRPLIEKLVPNISFQNRKRLSTLSYIGAKKTIRLPKRSAIVAFSALEVYEIAELVRRQLGGAAIVMGGLSPRTRNAQVAMYQAGEVDYIVATDAIGMGLNMDISHVAFAATRKFDGRYRRELSSSELAQIAGRAGRYKNNGTFGTTGNSASIPAMTAKNIENNHFLPIKSVYWRNSCLNFSSLEMLLLSLRASPDQGALKRVQGAGDELAFSKLMTEQLILDRARGINAIKLLWEVCQVPDFGGVWNDGHAQFLMQVYGYLTHPPFILPETWINFHVSRLEKMTGGIEHLTQRISAIRTWTYVSFRSDWTKNALYWRERTSAIEDKLSDVLNESLVKKFVDRRTTDLLRGASKKSESPGFVNKNGDVFVAGHFVGKISGLQFISDSPKQNDKEHAASRAIELGSHTILRKEIKQRLNKFFRDGNRHLNLKFCDRIKRIVVLWEKNKIATLCKGRNILEPRVDLIYSNLLSKSESAQVVKNLNTWVQNEISCALRPLKILQSEEVNGFAKGLCFQLIEGLGTLSRTQVKEEIRALKRAERKVLRKMGVVIGGQSIFLLGMLQPKAVTLRAFLWAIFNNYRGQPPTLVANQISLPVIKGVSAGLYQSMGFLVYDTIAIRVDIVEKLASIAWKLGRKDSFMINSELLSIAKCSKNDLSRVLLGLGFRTEKCGGNLHFSYDHRYNKKQLDNSNQINNKYLKNKDMGNKKRLENKKENLRVPACNSDSPFSVLKNLRFGP